LDDALVIRAYQPLGNATKVELLFSLDFLGLIYS